MFNSLVRFLEQNKIFFKQNLDAKPLVTAHTGGVIGLLLTAKNLQELKLVISYFYENSINYKIIGNGSNLLIPDEGIYNYPIVKLGEDFNRFKVNQDLVFSGAGVYLPKLAKDLCNQGVSGFEFAGGIPGTLGGAIRMNAGAHGSDISEVIKQVTVIDKKGGIFTLDKEKIQWSYRKNSIPEDNLILYATFKKNKEDPVVVKKRFQENLNNRRINQPLQYASFGSVFKNPDGQLGSAGKLIESVGLKGFSLGQAQVSKLHANWIINPKKNATTTQIVDLIKLCQEKVWQKYKITLEPEVIRW